MRLGCSTCSGAARVDTDKKATAEPKMIVERISNASERSGKFVEKEEVVFVGRQRVERGRKQTCSDGKSEYQHGDTSTRYSKMTHEVQTERVDGGKEKKAKLHAFSQFSPARCGSA